MDKQEIKQRLNKLYGKSSFESPEDTKAYADLMEELVACRHVDTDSVKPVDFFEFT